MQCACAVLYFLTSQPTIIDEKGTGNISAVPMFVIGRQDGHARTLLTTHMEFCDALQKSSQYKATYTCKTLSEF